MNWKEQFDKEFWVEEADDWGSTPNPSEIKSFISTQIIEKLIEDIPDDINDAALHTRISSNATGILKRQLRNKWLN